MNLGFGLSLLSGAMLACGLVVLPRTASAACVDAVGTVDCAGAFATGIDLTALQESKIITMSGVSVDDGGVTIAPDGGGAFDDIDITVVMDETAHGGTIKDGGDSALRIDSLGGDVALTAPMAAEGIMLHKVESESDGFLLITEGDGTVTVDTALSVEAGLNGYVLFSRDAGAINGDFRGTIEAGGTGIVAIGGGIVNIAVHDSDSADPEIMFSSPDIFTGQSKVYAGIFVDSGVGVESALELDALDPSEDGSVNITIADNVRIIGPYNDEVEAFFDHSGIFAQAVAAPIEISIGNNVTIDPVDYGIYSRSIAAAVLTTIGSGNTILVNDLDEDGTAIGIYADSGLVENPEDAAYPHAAAVVTGGNNEITVTGSNPGDFPVSGILAIQASKGESNSSALVSLGAYDDGQGNMVGDQITVVGSSENTGTGVPGLVGIGAASLSGVSETIHSVSILTADASAGNETMIVVGDDNADGDDGVSGNASAGVLAYAAGGSVNVDLGAYTTIAVVDNDDTFDLEANEAELAAVPGDNGDSRSNSFGIFAQSANGGAIGVGMNNTIGVTGGHGVYFQPSMDNQDATLEVSIGEGAVVVADYSSLLVDSGTSSDLLTNDLAAFKGYTTVGHVYVNNQGALIGGDDLNVGIVAGQSIELVNHASGYIGNDLDVLAANPDVEAILLRLGAPPSPKLVPLEAEDPEISADTGRVELVNYGTIVGRINLFGNTVDDDVLEILGDADDLNVAQLTNFGLWNFVGSPVALNAEVTIDNGGSILFVDRNGGVDNETTLGLFSSSQEMIAKSPTLLTFNNYAWDEGAGAYLPGTLSMVDGETGDLTGIGGAFDGGDYAAGYSGRLALDVHLPSEGDAESDVLLIDTGYLAGSTGVLVNQVEAQEMVPAEAMPEVEPYSGGFAFTNVDGEQIENTCDGYCLAGDAFYIAPESANYASVGYDGGQLGLIRDGLGAWVIEETLVEDETRLVPDNGAVEARKEPDLTRYSFVQLQAGPDSYLMPSLITGAQNVWYATDDIVQDQIAGGGGGGVSISSFGGSAVSSHNYGDGSSLGTNGVWLRATGNWTNQDSTVNDGMFSYDTSFDQDTYSVLAGIDGKIPDAPLRFGLFGGYVNSSLTFSGYGVDSEYEGGTVGAYAAWLQGGWRGDLLFKADLLDVSYQSTVGDVDADVTNLGLRANAGYRIEGGQGYVEPLASFAWVNTSIDNMGVGTATVQFSNANSVRAGAGLRVGSEQNLASGDIVALSLTGKLWNEFEDDNTVSITSMAGTDTYTDSIDGLFGEAIATMQYTALDPGLTGLVSVGARFNDDYLSWTARLGLRKSW